MHCDGSTIHETHSYEVCDLGWLCQSTTLLQVNKLLVFSRILWNDRSVWALEKNTGYRREDFVKKSQRLCTSLCREKEAKWQSISLKAKEKQQHEDQVRRGLPSLLHMSPTSHDESFVPKRPPTAPQGTISAMTSHGKYGAHSGGMLASLCIGSMGNYR